MANTTVKGKFNVVAENGDVQTIYPKTTGDQVLVDRSSNASVIPNDVANLQHIVNKMGSLALKSKVETSDFTTGTMINSIADLKSNTETGKIADATVVKDIESRVDTLENSNLVTVDELDAGLATKPDTEINDSVTSTSLTWSSKKLSDQLTTLNSNTSVLTSRVNNLSTLQEGSTTGDAELIGIRTGYDSTNYSSAGEAVREQVSALNDKLDNYITLNAGYKIIKKTEFNFTNSIVVRGGSNTTIAIIVNSDGVYAQNFSFDGNDIILTFHYNDISTHPYPNAQNLWIYGLFTIDITDLIGRDIYFTIKKELIYGEDKIRFNIFKITTTDKSWALTVKDINSNVMKDTFNLKDYISETDGENRYYLLIGYQSIVNSENERFIFGSECQYKFSVSYIDPSNTKVIATDLMHFNKSDYYTKTEVDSLLNMPDKYITCWGDSLTAGGGWTSRLQELTGVTVYNGGTGGENSTTICSRQGADAMIVNNITIPSDTSDVLIASKNTDHGLLTVENKRVTPLFQGSSANGTHFNPCKIGDIEGTLRWTGSNYADTSGTWVFKRSTAGDSSITINRPTVLRTNYDMNRNNPYLMIIFIGQNGGWDNDLDTLVRQHRLMIEHANAEHVIILGLSSGSATSRADYETRMKQEFGRYFISLREYLSTPIYENGEIVSCYGIEDQNAEIDMDYVATNASGKTVKQEITDGIVPHAILADGVHYTSGTKTVIGDLIYKRCKELNIF